MYLNLKIERNRQMKSIYISHTTKIKNVLEDSNLSAEDRKLISNPSRIPALTSLILSKKNCPINPEETKKMELVPYKSILGQLIHICITTRPDIAYAISNCGRYSHNPGPTHWHAILIILRYLQGTKELRLKLGGTLNTSFHMFCDADWAGDLDERKSRSGICIFLGDSLISWSSKLQKSIALSSTEAEYASAATGLTSLLWQRNLLEEIGFDMETSILYQDNNSASTIIESRKHQPGVKHVFLIASVFFILF
jgi:hypothetical protein